MVEYDQKDKWVDVDIDMLFQKIENTLAKLGS